jgi:hypothetical protein
MLRLRQFMTLATLTAREAVRQPIFALLAVSCVSLITALPVVLMHKFGEDGKLVRESALAFHFVFGLLITGTAAAWSLSREVRDGTAATVLSKPVGRDMFFLSKFMGVAAVSVAFSACVTVSVLLSERVSERFVTDPDRGGYVVDWHTAGLQALAIVLALLAAGLASYRRRPFGSSAFGFLCVFQLLAAAVAGFFDRNGAWAPFRLDLDWRILPASALVGTALVVLAAIALALSTRMPRVPTVTTCFILFLAGLMSDYLFGRHAGTSLAAMVLHRSLPNWQNFWLVDALADGGVIPFVYVIQALTYAALYTGAVLCMGLAFFRRVDVG